MKTPPWTLATFAAMATIAAAIQAQTPDERLRFEVASIKRNTACGGRGGGPTPGRLTMNCTTVQNLIQLAYGALANGVSLNFKALEITGAPGWVQTDTYEINAKAEGDAPFAQMAGPMMQKLLEERFKLKLHRESKEVQAYFLTVAKGGPKLERTDQGSCIPIDVNHLPPVPASGQPRLVFCGNGSITSAGPIVRMNQHGMTMNLLAGGLAQFAGHPVMDSTGLAGQYEIHLEFATENAVPGGGRRPDDSASPAQPTEPAAPSIFTALEEQLGLKLEPGKGKVEILVIEHVEPPSEN